MTYSAVIIGLGGIGFKYDMNNFTSNNSVNTHAKLLFKSNFYKLEGAVEVNEENGIEFNRETGIKVFSSIINLSKYLYNIDLVVIATPTETHYEIIKESIKLLNPKVILCEKPLSYSNIESDKIVEICNESNIGLFINLPRRVEKSSIKFKDLLRKTKYFKGVVWYSNGVINNGIHFIDLITFWFGKPKKIILNSISKNYKPLRNDYDIDFKLSYDTGEILFISWPEELYSNYKIEIATDTIKLNYNFNGTESDYNKVINDENFSGFKCISNKSNKIENNLSTSLISVYDDIHLFLSNSNNKSVLNDTVQISIVNNILKEIKTKIDSINI